MSHSTNLVNTATISASSEFELNGLPFDGPWMDLTFSAAQMLPVAPGKIPAITLMLKAGSSAAVEVELRISSNPSNHTPDTTIEKHTIALVKGETSVDLDFTYQADQHRYIFICLTKHDDVAVKCSNQLVTGLLTVFNKVNKAVSNYGKQTPPEDIGVEAFEFWCPNRRPEGHNFGMNISPGIKLFAPQNINNGIFRPTVAPNAWAAAREDTFPKLIFEWKAIQTINEIRIAFDTDYDHPMESSLMGHPENIMPYCIRHYRICNDKGEMVHEEKNNHQTINKIQFTTPLTTRKLVIEPFHPSANVRAGIFEVVIR